MMTVDEFVKNKVLPQYHDVVTMLRQLMHELAPDAEEVVSYGMPVYKGQRIFAWIIPSKKDITFGFMRGKEFEDRYKLLRGVGKRARHVKIKSLDTANKEALEYYIKQALELDKQ